MVLQRNAPDDMPLRSPRLRSGNSSESISGSAGTSAMGPASSPGAPIMTGHARSTSARADLLGLLVFVLSGPALTLVNKALLDARYLAARRYTGFVACSLSHC